MNYNWLTYNEIEKAKYPNLLAELKESGYSICTISDFMGLGIRGEDDKTIWNKLYGIEEITLEEAANLCKYYGVNFTYLFAQKLTIVNEKSQAYWRWYDENQKKQAEIERSKAIMEIYNELVSNPELLEFMKWCKTLTKEQRQAVLVMMHEEKGVAYGR